LNQGRITLWSWDQESAPQREWEILGGSGRRPLDRFSEQQCHRNPKKNREASSPKRAKVGQPRVERSLWRRNKKKEEVTNPSGGESFPRRLTAVDQSARRSSRGRKSKDRSFNSRVHGANRECSGEKESNWGGKTNRKLP